MQVLYWREGEIKRLLSILLLFTICFTAASGVVAAKNNRDITIPDSTTTPDIKPINEYGLKLGKINISQIPEQAIALVSIEKGNGQSIQKTVQLRKNSKVRMSVDGETVMQTSAEAGEPQVELYFGYQKDLLHPWQYYYRVEGSRTVWADFNEHRVWIAATDYTKLNDIVASPDIPAWEELS